MSPFVIDGKKKQQYVVVFIFSIIASFALGFTSGYFSNQPQTQQSYDQLKSQIFSQSETDDDDSSAVPGNDMDDSNAEAKEVEVDKPVKKTDSGVEKLSTDKTSPPGKPAPAVKVSTAPSPKPEAKKVAAVKPAPRPAPKPKPAVKPVSRPAPKPAPITASSPIAPPVEKPAAEVVPTSAELAPVAPPQDTTELLPVGPASSDADADPAQDNSSAQAFAVQVGMFANRDNAQKLVYELIDNGYDAYMDEFVSTSGELKYNVRFGRYADRASVQSRLAEYKQAYNSPAYIIITK